MDYGAVSETLTFQLGGLPQILTFNVSIREDFIIEETEQFRLVLTTRDRSVTVRPDVSVVDILDDGGCVLLST